jgi:glutamate carboxypeptidase
MSLPLMIADFAPYQPEMLSMLERFASMESPSTDKAAVDRLGAAVAAELQALGAQLTPHPLAAAGDHIEARWNFGTHGGPSPEASPLLILCHMDTVYEAGTLARFPLRAENGYLHGPGVYDMKGGIVGALFAVRLLMERGLMERPLVALFTSDEETGSATSRPLIEALARQAAAVFCLEPAAEDGSLKTARKGTGEIEIVARGQAAHAGIDHARGRNAIEELAHHILAVQRLTDYPRGTTVNVGLVSGGTRINVVPNEARARVDLRIPGPEEAAHLEAWVAGLQPVIEGCTVEARITFKRPPMPRDAVMAAAFARAQAIVRRLGLELSETSTGGGSDANYVAPLGVPVLDGLGVRGGGAHSERECMQVASLSERAALLASLIMEW